MLQGCRERTRQGGCRLTSECKPEVLLVRMSRSGWCEVGAEGRRASVSARFQDCGSAQRQRAHAAAGAPQRAHQRRFDWHHMTKALMHCDHIVALSPWKDLPTILQPHLCTNRRHGMSPRFRDSVPSATKRVSMAPCSSIYCFCTWHTAITRCFHQVLQRNTSDAWPPKPSPLHAPTCACMGSINIETRCHLHHLASRSSLLFTLLLARVSPRSALPWTRSR